MKAGKTTRSKASRKISDRRILGDLKKYGRSRVSNGRDLLPGVDGRSLVVRRLRDIATAVVADQGGPGQCSEARTQLIRRFAACSVVAERMEADLANGRPIDINEHVLLCSALVRIASRIGLDRRQKNVTPRVDDYLRDRTIDAEPIDDDVDMEAAE